MRVIAGVVWWMVTAPVVAGAIDVVMDRQAVNAAILLGQTRIERDRTRFHEPYRVAVNKAPLDYIDIVTPFRLVVLAAETRAKTGDRSFGQRQALEILAAAAHQVDVHVEFTFHPLNTYIGVPEYAVRLEEEQGAAASATRIRLPIRIERAARFGARVEGTPLSLPVPGGIAPGKSQPMLGGSVVARFDGQTLNAVGTYDVIVSENGKELGRARVDFSRLR
jgi:hypothetical protein